jgi:hypothetical protein
MFFVCCLCFIVTVNAETPVVSLSTVEPASDGKWIVNHPDSRKIYAVQCGVDVTLFALKYFKVEYSLPRVSLGLPLSENGISIADIQQMFQVYGLKTDA